MESDREMKKFIDFIIEGLASPEQQSVQRRIEQIHNDAIRNLLSQKGYIENPDAEHPDHLELGQFKFFNPSADDTIRGDLHVNHEGTIISIECKGKNPDRPKHKSGAHQNDYILRVNTPIRRRTPKEFATRGKAGEILASKNRVRASKISANWKKVALSAIPDLFKSLGSDITISGSKHGVAIIPHAPILGIKDKKRQIIDKFLENIGLSTSHEIHELGTAGAPEFRSDRRDRGVFRIGGISGNDKSKANGQILYPQKP